MRLATCWLSLALAITVAAQPAKAQGAQKSPLPALTGEYAVGRTQFDWTDTSRADAENPGGHREIVVWVWYPASIPPAAEAAEWMPGKWGELYWANFLRGHPNAADAGNEHPINTIRTHAYVDAPAPARQQQFPVLLLAPGLGATPLEYATLIEDAVSHGYVVAGIVPTWFAGATVFSDGRVVRGRDIMALPGGAALPRPSLAQAMRRFEEVAGIWSHDLTFTLNQLAIVNGDARSPLKGRMDFTRVGAIGHSMGGASVVQLASDDPRVRAVFDIDGSPIWKADNRALGKPLLVLSASATNVSYDAVLDGAAPGIQLRLAGSAHTFSSDFRLMPFMPTGVRSAAPAMSTAVSAAIDPARALKVTAHYLEAFFDQYLKGSPAVLLAGPSPQYPEITFERGAVKHGEK